MAFREFTWDTMRSQGRFRGTQGHYCRSQRISRVFQGPLRDPLRDPGRPWAIQGAPNESRGSQGRLKGVSGVHRLLKRGSRVSYWHFRESQGHYVGTQGVSEGYPEVSAGVSWAFQRSSSGSFRCFILLKRAWNFHNPIEIPLNTLKLLRPFQKKYRLKSHSSEIEIHIIP